MTSSVIGCWRRGYWKNCPDDWQTPYKIWDGVFLGLFGVAVISIGLQTIFMIIERRTMPEASKRNMRLAIISLFSAWLTILMYFIVCIIPFAADGDVVNPYFIEFMHFIYMVGSLIQFPIFYSWLRVIAAFVEGPVSNALLRKLKFTSSRTFKIIALIYGIFVAILGTALSMVGAISEDLYFVGVRGFAAAGLFIYVPGLVFSAIFGRGVLSILNMQKLSEQQTKKVLYNQESKTDGILILRYMKFQVYIMIGFAGGLGSALVLAPWIIAQIEQIDVDFGLVIFLHTAMRGVTVFIAFGLQLGLHFQYLIAAKIKAHELSRSSRSMSRHTPHSGYKDRSKDRSQENVVEMSANSSHSGAIDRSKDIDVENTKSAAEYNRDNPSPVPKEVETDVSQ